jgi:hypothetical protein
MEQNETIESPENPEPPPDAVIELRHTGQGIDVSVIAADEPMNPAIHFGNWLGRNLQSLLALAREDYNHRVDQHKAARRVLTATPRIMGPDGSPLQ